MWILLKGWFDRLMDISGITLIIGLLTAFISLLKLTWDGNAIKKMLGDWQFHVVHGERKAEHQALSTKIDYRFNASDAARTHTSNTLSQQIQANTEHLTMIEHVTDALWDAHNEERGLIQAAESLTGQHLNSIIIQLQKSIEQHAQDQSMIQHLSWKLKKEEEHISSLQQAITDLQTSIESQSHALTTLQTENAQLKRQLTTQPLSRPRPPKTQGR